MREGVWRMGVSRGQRLPVCGSVLTVSYLICLSTSADGLYTHTHTVFDVCVSTKLTLMQRLCLCSFRGLLFQGGDPGEGGGFGRACVLAHRLQPEMMTLKSPQMFNVGSSARLPSERCDVIATSPWSGRALIDGQ